MTIRAQARQSLRYYPLMALFAASFLHYELPAWIVIIFLVLIALSGLSALGVLLFVGDPPRPATPARLSRRTMRGRRTRGE